MAIAPFLAMTAAEIRENTIFPSKTAWLGCRFSTRNPGLSNLPTVLPSESLLILTDQTPFDGHDPGLILRQLGECLERLSCRALLLDFQRPGIPEVAELSKQLTASLPCPVIVSACYGQDQDCPIFLPPVPPSVPLQEWLSPWKGREIWQELAMDGECITLTEQGAEITPLPYGWSGDGFSDKQLNCHYHIEQGPDTVKFTLWRTGEDLAALAGRAEVEGITHFVGWYRELHCFSF